MTDSLTQRLAELIERIEPSHGLTMSRQDKKFPFMVYRRIKFDDFKLMREILSVLQELEAISQWQEYCEKMKEGKP